MITSNSKSVESSKAPQEQVLEVHPHAFHLNLPPHFKDDDDHVPDISKFAAKKAQQTIDLCFRIQLDESLFECSENNNVSQDDDEDTMLLNDDDDDMIEEQVLPATEEDTRPETLQTLSKKCFRLVSLLSSLETYKVGLPQDKLARMVLHLLRLVTATITYDDNGKPTLHYENVGGIVQGTSEMLPDDELPETQAELKELLAQDFALPTPTRETLLLALIHIVSNKPPLRSMSNAAIYTDEDNNNKNNNRSRLLLQWKSLLVMLLRTSPHLDEHALGRVVQDSNARCNSVVKRTVTLIRDARHFFEQKEDQSAKEIWGMVRTDVLFHSHTHACYRGTILLYLFLPSRCTPGFYKSVLLDWYTAWTNVERCPEYDFLWLALFSRARKYIDCAPSTAAADSEALECWIKIRKRILTHSQYWLQLPIGGKADSSSWPQMSNPRSRSCPPRLKVFVGQNHDEGIDFVAKVAKLFVSGLGTGQVLSRDDNSPGITEGTNDVLMFLSFVTPYFNPSNLGRWTFTLGAFLHYFCYELCSRMGAVSGNHALQKTHPAVVAAWKQSQPGSHCAEIPPHEVVALLEALLPLCQQALYSKNGHVGRAGEAAMLYLVQIDPEHSTAAFIDFACQALDISAVNLSHQAPAALSALTRLVQPALRSDPSILLARLPEMLRLTLAGIDSNDQNKSIRTLIFYRNLTSWIPVGGKPESWPQVSGEELSVEEDGTLRLGKDLYQTLSDARKSQEYRDALQRLKETSLLRQGIVVDEVDVSTEALLLEEATSAMSDWALEFLERVFGLLRASGEREKTTKSASRVASRHSSADVHQARNFSRVLKETLLQVFAAMDDDTHRLALRTVTRFLEEETLPAAAKDSSLLCQAVASSREGDVRSPGLDALIPILTDDLRHHSTKTVAYRLRCLAGAVRSASHGVVKHRVPISESIEFALSSDDRHLFKTGCKLLRHTLSTLSESYPISSGTRPRSFLKDSSPGAVFLGKSAQLHGDAVQWHVPTGESIEFAEDLLTFHVIKRLDALCSAVSNDSDGTRSKLLNSLEVLHLRRCLRVIRYSIRGGASILLDDCPATSETDSFVPYEKASRRVIDDATDKVRDSIISIRGRLSVFMVVLSSVIASETLYPDWTDELSENDPYRKTFPLISSDPKVCKETSDISLLLLTRRGAAFRSQESRTIWKAQKQMAADFILCAQVDHMAEALQCASLYGDATNFLYKDGEDGGKTIPRRLLVSRVQLFHDSMQRSASFEVPKRLRRAAQDSEISRNRLFVVKPSLHETVSNLEDLLVSPAPRSLDTYEGITDGLYALCCNSSTLVRASALSVIDYTMTRFGWLVAARIPRLLHGLALEDEDLNGKFGLPSCSSLVADVNQQGKRKKLAEAVKGVCSILSLPRSMKHVLQSAKMRLMFAKTVCGSDSLISMLPPEEIQKLVHYLQAVFSPFRSKIYWQPRISQDDVKSHTETLNFLLDLLVEKKTEDETDPDASAEVGAVHWRKMLLGCWFLITTIDSDDLRNELPGSVAHRTWSICFRILENEKGQPLQRVALGLFGRLVYLSDENAVNLPLKEKMSSDSFCRALGEALVFDHKEDSSVGGGHRAQWATGVEDLIRDSARNIAPRTLFPFQRTSQALSSFKASHAQLLEKVLLSLDEQTAKTAVPNLLRFSIEIVAAPPSEDQRNQHITSAEIFAAVCGSMLRRGESNCSGEWSDLLIPHLEDAMGKIPFALSGAYFDAIRYALQFCSPRSFYPLTQWLVEKITNILWQPSKLSNESTSMAENGSTHGTDGFTAQSKWLYLFTAVLIEMDESEAGNSSRPGWYTGSLLKESGGIEVETAYEDDLETSWNLVNESLLPHLAAALGHPFDSCRDHISRCLFRICYCHRKRERISASLPQNNSNLAVLDTSGNSSPDPGSIVVRKLASLENRDAWALFTDRYNALNTARRFIAYCVHLGEAKFEYSDYVIPLLPLAFEAINPTVDDDTGNGVVDGNQEENAAMRALEAEVVKGYRYTIAEVSITSVISYGRDSDIGRVLDTVENASRHEKWQVRQAATHFLRCFQGAHKFMFSPEHNARTMQIVADLLADDRREVSSAAMAALTGIIASRNDDDVARMVQKYIPMANRSKMKRPSKGKATERLIPTKVDAAAQKKEAKRARNQKTSVFFLCSAVMAHPYNTPMYVPEALAAISKHSFERNAPLGVRDMVKRCCADYKKTHMSDNWELHRSVFSQEQLEAFEDVVSTPHYYA